MPLYIFQSSESIADIREQISRYGQPGPIHIMRGRDGRETNLNYVLLDEKTAGSVPGFRFRKYEFREPNYPGQGYTWNLFINLDPRLNDKTEQEKALLAKLQPLIDYGLFKTEDISKIHIPYSLREFNRSRGFAYIKFSPNVDKEAIITTKIFLDNSYWLHLLQPLLTRCDWAKVPKKRTATEDKNKPSAEMEPGVYRIKTRDEEK